MSTKATIQALINNIADGQPNTALEARTAYNALLNELYPNLFSTKWDAPVKTVQLNSRFRYDFSLYKMGNTVFLNGRFYTNIVAGISANNDCFGITDTEFKNYSLFLTTIIGMAGIRFQVNDGVFKNLDPIEFGNNYYFNISYPTNP